MLSGRPQNRRRLARSDEVPIVHDGMVAEKHKKRNEFSSAAGRQSSFGQCGNTAMLRCMKTHLLSVQSRGTIALPADLRRRLHLDGPDAQVKLIERDDGRVELLPVVAVPADQAWFWTERWQGMEREADADVAAGRTTVVDGLKGLTDLFAADDADR